MKRFAAALLSLFIARAGSAQSSGSDVPVTGQGASTTVIDETAVRKPVDLQSSQVQVVTTVRDDSGKSSYLTNSYTEVASGLNYLGTNGMLLPSVAAWELVPGAAIAWKTQTKVTLGATLDSAAPVQIRLPTGELMSSRVQGVAIFDAQSGKSVLVSEIKEGVQGIQITPDQIIYPDCLQGAISGDLRYTIRLDGVEQDLIIRQADLLSASLESLGFAGADPANITIETWSEFLTSPEPQVQAVLRQDSVDGQSVAMADQELSFGGSMKMAAGRSFLVGQESQTLGLVSKQWITTSDSRRFLVESTPLVLVEGKLSAVPAGQPGAMKSSRKASRNRMEALNALPRHRSDRQEASILPLKSAAKGLLAWLSLPGLILDYSTVSGSLTNYTFAGNVTYYLSSDTTCTGTNTWVEGGAVLKYTNGVSLTIKTPLTWQAAPYRPVVLCSWADKSIGQPISGASGTPGTNIYAATALILDASSSGALNTAFNLAHLRIANAQTAIQIIQGTNPHAIRHAQFVNCGTGISATSTTFSLYNALLANVRTGFGGSSVVGDLEHLTVDGGDYFQNGTVFSSLGLTNCLIAGVTNVSVGTSVIQSFIYSSNAGLFQNLSVGTSHYLPTNSPFRNVGTTTINPTLAGELIDLTTAAPIELGTNWTVAANTYLQPQAARDTDIPDIGYHA
ncbi:MAG TPA: hypothetical protein VMF06_09180, partial [Candidatus Limnocylindria bacterium]|nr:hypothetical protein [Candidatus Limnocylindria bacterium]